MLIRIPKRQVALLTFGWAAAGMVVLLLVLAGRESALERGRRSSSAFAFIVEQQTEQAMQSIQLTLGAVVDALRLSPGLPKNDPEFRQLLRRRLAEAPIIRAIFLIDRDGWIAHDTDYPATPDVRLADRPYFRRHQLEPSLDKSISPPLLSRAGAGWFFAVSRRLGQAGEFEGIAVAAVQADYFSRQFEKVGLPADDAIALFHESGVLVARHPSAGDAGVGESFSHLELFSTHLPRRRVGGFITSESLAPGERLVSYRAIPDSPLVVTVSSSSRAMLAEWRRTAVGAAVAMGALTVLLGLFIAYLARAQRREEMQRERSVQSEKLEALGQLTGGIAHDFGNMLAVVSVNLALLKELPRDSAGADEALSVAERAVRRGMELIDRLLRFSTRQPLNIAPVDLDEALAASRDLLANAAGARIALEVERRSGLPKALCDESQLEMALVNLVVNARDAMGGAGRIALRTYPCGDDDRAELLPGTANTDYVCLAVQDFGPGMTEETRKRVLEPYFTTKGQAGRGLGLPQVYGFMRQLGGSIRIDSKPGKGTTIHLFFPIAGKP